MVQMSPLCMIRPLQIHLNITRQFLATNIVNVLDWPANSPHLNPIEQVLDKLGYLVQRNHAIHTVNDLAVALQAEWANLPAPFIQHYINSMCHHITENLNQSCYAIVIQN